MGGLARRVSYEKLFRKNLAQVPLFVVESGEFMNDERNAHGELRPDVSIKDDWIMKGYDQFPADVINVSSHDLRYVSRLLRKGETVGKTETQAILKRLVSANITSNSPDKIAPQPFVIREVPGRQSAKPVRVAFVGLTETRVAAPRGFKFTDAIETARRVVPEAKKRADVVVAIAYLNKEDAQRLATEVPGIDAIITANSQSDGVFFVPPVTVGKTLIAFTAYETRMMGELRFYQDAPGIFSVRTRYISLDTEVPDDPAALQVVNAAREAEGGAQEKSKALLLGWLESARGRKNLGQSESAYISSSACAKCHMDQYIRWSNSRHAHATDSLVSRQFEFEAGCLSCHATAQSKTSATELTKMQHVQCEQCHGPGGDHAAKPGKGYGRVTDIQTACATCHTPDINPDFDAKAAWAKIKH